MKRNLLLVSVLCLSIISVFGQKSNISKAKTKAFNVEAPDPQGAKDLIEKALVHPETANDAKTWFSAGEIFNEITSAETTKQSWGQTYDAKLREECIVKILPFLLKANELDQLPNAKGKIKPKYTKKIKKLLVDLYKGSSSIEWAAGEAFNNKNYAKAAEIFDIFINIPLTPLVGKEIDITNDTNYTAIKYNSGIAHYQAGGIDHLNKAVQYFQELTESNYSDKNSVYQILLSLYLSSINDTVNYVKNLEVAVEKFPKEAYYIEQLINYYVKKKENIEAINYLEKAIENEPTFEQYYFLLGNVKEELGLIEEASVLYDKTIEMNPEHYFAFISKGNIIYNKAVDIDTKASEIKDNKEYQKAKAEANALLEKSLPFYERALELKPDDYENIRWLRSIYYRLDKKDKYNEMEQRLNNR